MQIECPHCQTSYDIAADAIGPEGRQVRCARCRNVWRAMPQAAMEFAGASAKDADEAGFAAAETSAQDNFDTDAAGVVPDIASPPTAMGDDDPDAWTEAETVPQSRFGRLSAPGAGRFGPAGLAARLGGMAGISRMPVAMRRALRIGLPGLNVILIGLCLGVVFLRADLVRAMPQTAGFFETIGLGVNLRGLVFVNTAIAHESVGGARVMVIEGTVKSVSTKPVELPRLHFGVHDEKGQEIFSWTAALDKPYLRAGEEAPYATRLASPPEQARSVLVRFLTKSDILRAGQRSGKSGS